MNGDDERCCHSRFPQAGGKPWYPYYVLSTGSHLILTKAKTMLSFPVGVENDHIRSTLIKTILFQDLVLKKYRFFV